jgi:hypothetical protein
MKGDQKFSCHECCPKEFKSVPNITGHHELDAVIHKNGNKDIPARMRFYLENEEAYGPKTGYSGYHGYSGDD